jgi:hypothetical protein
MPKNYYVLLGLDSDATQDEIKSAYRRKVKRLHPDQFEGGSEPFLALQEAYEVLCDPVRRRRYDGELARRRGTDHTAWRVSPEPLRPRRRPVEPLVPAERATGPRDPFSGSWSHSLFEELLRRPWRDVDAATLPGVGGAGSIHMEVFLTRARALRGGRIQLRIPLQFRCPACRGQGGLGFFECPRCSGTGVVADEYPVDVALPEGVADGDTGSIPLRRPGMRDVHLTLHFRVQKRG